MALSDYSSLQTSVASYMARSDLTSNIPDFITLFEAEANRSLRTRQMEITQSTTPTSGTFSLPTDYVGWKTVTWSAGGLSRSLQYVHPSELPELYPDSPAANPRVFSILGTTDQIGYVQLMPTANDAVNFTYYQKITNLSTTAGSTTNWLLLAHPDAYLAGAMTEACVFVKDYDTGAIWKSRRDALFDEITNLDERTRGPSAIRVPGRNP